MKLQDQVCTLEQAKRLKELGIIQQGNFKWNQNIYEKEGDIEDGAWTIWYNQFPATDTQYVAFSVAELGVMLPQRVNDPENLGKYLFIECNHFNSSMGYRCWLDNLFHPQAIQGDFRSEAEARAAMLIHLLENNLITAESVNQTLTSNQ